MIASSFEDEISVVPSWEKSIEFILSLFSLNSLATVNFFTFSSISFMADISFLPTNYRQGLGRNLLEDGSVKWIVAIVVAVFVFVVVVVVGFYKFREICKIVYSSSESTVCDMI